MNEKPGVGDFARHLALISDLSGWTEFEVFGAPKDAFREVHDRHIVWLDRQFDKEFEKLRRQRVKEVNTIMLNQKGGENMAEKPIKEFRAGGCRATVWRHEREKDGRKFNSDSVQLTRTYKDTEGNWKDVSSFRPQDLGYVLVAIGAALDFVALTERDPRAKSDGPE